MDFGLLLGTKAKSAAKVKTLHCGGAHAAWAHWQGSRQEQQDVCGVFCSGTLLLGAVADGMGGLAQGALAAQAAIDACARETETLARRPLEFETLQAALLRVNRAVHDASAANAPRIGGPTAANTLHSADPAAAHTPLSGTTLVAAAVQQGNLRLMWSGDSRAYLWRRGKLIALTFDHNYRRQLMSLVAEGVLTEEQARSHPKGGHLTGYLGLWEPRDYSISGTATAISPGDVLLLCTDGLYRTLGEGALRKYLSLDAEKAASGLINAVIRANLPNQDNATACVVQF